MNLFEGLSALERPVRCAVIGCGKFATMFLSQVGRVDNIEVRYIADLSPDRVVTALGEVGYDAAALADAGPALASAEIVQDAAVCLEDPAVEVVIEATGDALAGARHALAAIDAGKHVVMVTVEADVLVGPLLAERAAAAGVVYTMAYGDQPALVMELIDWARTTGFEVVAAGKGTKYLPEYRYSTPDTVWGHYGFEPEYARASGLNPTMFNSFLDGTKSAIEMAAIANAAGLVPRADGLQFPPCGMDELASVCIPQADGGALDRRGTVEVVSSLHRDGSPVERDLRWGVYVTFAAPSGYVADCFRQYGVRTDASGRYASMYRPSHLIGLELAVSVAAIAVRREATGRPRGFVADVVACAKRDLQPGDVLDGEGGYALYGTVVPAEDSVARGLLPIGLSNRARVTAPVARDAPIRADQVAIDERSPVITLRHELEDALRAPIGNAR